MNQQPASPVDLQPLLSRIAIGAAQSMFKLSDWQTQLSDVTFGQEFLNQLDQEWMPADPPDDFCTELLDTCRARISQWHSGWPNLWAHTLRVIGYALAGASDAGMAPNRAFALAALHDVGKLDEMRSGEPHESIAAHAARELLKGQFSRAEVNAIAAAVGKEGFASNPFVRLLYDADKLDKIGATGIVRRVSQSVEISGAMYLLSRVEADLDSFPDLNYKSTRQLVLLKRQFTSWFLAAAQNHADAPAAHPD